MDIIRAWESIGGNSKISAKGSQGCSKLKKYNPLFDKGPQNISS
jgi:hypothetical protein